jgi:hypothetical protein
LRIIEQKAFQSLASAKRRSRDNVLCLLIKLFANKTTTAFVDQDKTDGYANASTSSEGMELIVQAMESLSNNCFGSDVAIPEHIDS